MNRKGSLTPLPYGGCALVGNRLGLRSYDELSHIIDRQINDAPHLLGEGLCNSVAW